MAIDEDPEPKQTQENDTSHETPQGPYWHNRILVVKRQVSCATKKINALDSHIKGPRGRKKILKVNFIVNGSPCRSFYL